MSEGTAAPERAALWQTLACQNQVVQAEFVRRGGPPCIQTACLLSLAKRHSCVLEESLCLKGKCSWQTIHRRGQIQAHVKMLTLVYICVGYGISTLQSLRATTSQPLRWLNLQMYTKTWHEKMPFGVSFQWRKSLKKETVNAIVLCAWWSGDWYYGGKGDWVYPWREERHMENALELCATPLTMVMYLQNWVICSILDFSEWVNVAHQSENVQFSSVGDALIVVFWCFHS